ncbi:MAG TPA: ChbG/HpnK family deacetylase [Lentibacillus sp.]|uniref:ChbG/HpnK family deacetylase n=1 Tax=Lentibacillus sp. TaxID=1925746 RepID=UPI002B4ABCA4|nr:ChbG/HpnK family deacetylase [Lentibacillus sp.]HLR61514.1 ChbG/HpnK family deacetylase [Lentibacillus sp.]
MKVLFNADDFGLTKGVTDGIIEAHEDGVIGSATMMMNGHAVDYAVSQARKHPSLRLGVHLVLTWGKPVSHHVPGLVNEDGDFRYKNTFFEMEPPNIKEVEMEWRAQIEAFLNTGLKLHHLDSHHHIHGWVPLKEVIVTLAHDYNVPVRYVDSLKEHPEILLTESLWPNFYGDGANVDVFDELKELNTRSVEVMTHPAYIDDLRSISSYLEKREEERKILCQIVPPQWVEMM